MEPRMVERSNLDDLCSESLNPGLSKANSKPGQKKSPFLPNPAWVEISVPCNQKIPK